MASLAGLSLPKNVSYYTVPVALFACIFPSLVAVTGSRGVYDNANPRNLTESIGRSEALSKEAKQRVIRAKAASSNGFETIGLYAAAVVAANHAGVDISSLNRLTVGYTISRFVYVILYVNLGAVRSLAPVRSAVWMVGISAIVALFIKGGNNLSG
ncbi:hypothetical protein NLG97_g2269 [Lecanicillium saksenae]|uniref:Uncharacterized protein n=1 Tax=Lecanicillium saksenae TaxID=468837 RepID=A0ACC1R4T7_9HYPO|nr:hypothetical protein NLG97_g2269 [Lecanicillium saksenae]